MRKIKWFVLLMAVLLFACPGSRLASAETAIGSDQTQEESIEHVTVAVERAMDHVTIANPTRMKGNFFSSLWGNDTADIDVCKLIQGYNLIEFSTDNGQFDVDPSVVSGIVVTQNEAGDRSYVLVLYDDLYFSDGSRITAWDYAFSFLFEIDMQMNALGGIASQRDYLLGYADYTARAAQLKNTQLVRDAQGRLVEQVLSVRLEAADGTAQDADLSAVMGERTALTLVRNADNELVLPVDGAEAAADSALVHVDAQGVITDWHYENGVRVYADGSRACLPGVQVLADDILMITIDHEYLPFFYEMGLLACDPYPISVIAPGVTVKDDGQGVYLANADARGGDAPLFTVDLLRQTVLDEKTGYLRHPSVVAGPYMLTDFDGTTAEFELNPRYKGNSQGQTPAIARITYTLADNDTMVQKLATGEFDVLNKVTKASTLNEALTLFYARSYTVREEAADGTAVETEYVSPGGFRMNNYPRAGMSFISFCCEQDTVRSQAVRQAVAWCADRDQIASEYTGGYGLRVDGYYGLGQWMYRIVQGSTAYPVPEPEDEDDEAGWAAYDAEIAEWETLSLENLTEYTVDVERARRLLSEDGWMLNADGIREKDGVALDLVLIYPQGNRIAESFERHLLPNLEQAGIRLTLVPVPMEELLRVYYRLPASQGAAVADDLLLMDETGARHIDMIYLASNFETVFDPSIHFVVENGTHNWASSGNGDEELYRLALDMRRTAPGQVLEYMKKWIAFEERFNETLPMLPIYSNVYFDFSIGELNNYRIDGTITWSQAIVGAYLEPQAAGEEPDAFEDEEFFDEESFDGDDDFSDDEIVIID